MPYGRIPIAPKEYIPQPIELWRIFSRVNAFQSERSMCDLLERNINHFAETYLGTKVKEYKREYRIGPGDFIKFGVVRPRADFYIETTNGERIVVEVKNGGRLHDNLMGITQLLVYNELDKFDRLILLTSTFSQHIPNMVSSYNLPIEVVYFNKEYATRNA